MNSLGVFFDEENTDGTWTKSPEFKYAGIHEYSMEWYLGNEWLRSHELNYLPTCAYPDLIILAVF